MALLIDQPRWPAHGRLWSHLVSDASYEELHEFAARAGLPRRSFEGDHYDVPAERYDAVVRAGAQAVEGRVLVAALLGSGLRLPKRKGERVLATWPDAGWLGDEPPHRVDCLASPLPPPAATTLRAVVLDVRDGLVRTSGDGLPAAARDVSGRPCGYLRARFDGSPRRVHVAALAGGAAGSAASTAGRWLPVQGCASHGDLRFWLPLITHLQDRA